MAVVTLHIQGPPSKPRRARLHPCVVPVTSRSLCSRWRRGGCSCGHGGHGPHRPQRRRSPVRDGAVHGGCLSRVAAGRHVLAAQCRHGATRRPWRVLYRQVRSAVVWSGAQHKQRGPSTTAIHVAVFLHGSTSGGVLARAAPCTCVPVRCPWRPGLYCAVAFACVTMWRGVLSDAAQKPGGVRVHFGLPPNRQAVASVSRHAGAAGGGAAVLQHPRRRQPLPSVHLG